MKWLWRLLEKWLPDEEPEPEEPRLEIGACLRYRGSNFVIHTAAWRANEPNFIGATQIDGVSPGNVPRHIWMSPDDAYDALWAYGAYRS